MAYIDSKGQYINGQWGTGKGPQFKSINPSDGSVVWQGKQATEKEIIDAHQAAQQALHPWSLLPLSDRIVFMQRFAQIVDEKRKQLRELISLETGKPSWEADTEVNSVIGKINLSIQAYHERTGEKHTKTPEANSCLRFKPQGVAVILGPFNFPAHLSNGHIVPALLAGNTILYKPSEQTPAVAEFIIQCWHEAELPPGVINCLQGSGGCGKTLLSQDIQAVYFTGSYNTGLAIHQQFSRRPEVILALEMGGNNPMIVDEVENILAAVYTTLLSTVITAGQRCTCVRRLIIPRSAWGERFLETFINACQQLKIGCFTEQPEPFMGPVISYQAALQHMEKQKKLIHLGGKSLLTMQLIHEHTGFLSPGIIDMESVSFNDEEIFAPLIQVYRYSSFDEAIAFANQTKYGLVAGLMSDKKQHYQQFYQQVRAGLINWNRPTTGAASNLPFGGIGLSGNHRPSAYFAADYCAYPVASMEQADLALPTKKLPGIFLDS